MVESGSALRPREDPAPGGPRSERLGPIEALEAVTLPAPPDLAPDIAAMPEDVGTEGLQPATVVGMAMFVGFAVYHAIAVELTRTIRHMLEAQRTRATGGAD